MHLLGEVSTLAGAYNADYALDGTGTSALVGTSYGVALADHDSVLYIAQKNHFKIRRLVVATGVVTTYLGTGTTGSADGVGTAAQLASPGDVVLTEDESIMYLADGLYIRRVSMVSGAVSTIAGHATYGDSGWVGGSGDGTGTNAQFASAHRAVLADNQQTLLIADSTNYRIRRLNVTSGVVTTLFGNGTSGYLDGEGTHTMFRTVNGLALYGDNVTLFIADSGNNRIRRADLSTSQVSTAAGSAVRALIDGTGTFASFYDLSGLAVTGCTEHRYMYIAENTGNVIRRMHVTTGVVQKVAGDGGWGDTDGYGTNAAFYNVLDVAVTSRALEIYAGTKYKIRQVK
eukprot:gene18520-22108_t